MTPLGINAVKLTQMSQMSQAHRPFLVTTLKAFWETGYASNTSDPTTFLPIGTSGTSGVNLDDPTIQQLYTDLIAQIQTDTGLTFVQNSGTITLFDAFAPILPTSPATPPTSGTTTTVTGAQLVCPFMFYVDALANYYTLARYILMNGTTPVSGILQAVTTPSGGDKPEDVYNNLVAQIGTQVNQKFAGSGTLDVFTDPYSS